MARIDRKLTEEQTRFLSYNHASELIYLLPHIVIYWKSTLIMWRWQLGQHQSDKIRLLSNNRGMTRWKSLRSHDCFRQSRQSLFISNSFLLRNCS